MTSARSSGTVVLSPLASRHRDATRAWMNDPECMRLLNRHHLIATDEHARWFDALGSSATTKYFAIETAPGEHVGNIWLADIDRRHRKAEVRIVIGTPEARARGVGSNAIELLAAEAFGPLELRRLYAYVLAFNLRARRAFERAGFAIEGTLREDRLSEGRFVDTWLLARLADDRHL